MHDYKLGEEVCVWVKPKEGQDISKAEVIEFMKGKIAHFKIPKYVKIVDEFPLTVTGKVKKHEMRDITNKILEDGNVEFN